MSAVMPELLERCAGLDVHKKTIVACIMNGFGKEMKREIRTFKTFTHSLRELAKWLVDQEIKECVIESTGPYWKPVFNILEGEFNLNISLANACHIKNHPDRKSDVKDSEWLCRLLKTGFVRKSFIPPIDIRDLKDIVRLRQSHIEVLTAGKNRLNKTLESKNIKLSSVLNDIFGITGFKVILLIASGECRPTVLAKCFKRKGKASIDDIKNALTGKLEAQDIKLVQYLLRHIDEQFAFIEDLDKEIDLLIIKYKIEVDLLKTIPGIGDKVATVIISEAGINMKAFPSEQHFSSWTGLTPSTNESAGVRKNTSIRGGNSHIRKTLVQAAWGAIKVKQSYWNAEFNRLRPRLGAKKAIIAIARKIAECIYVVLNTKRAYQERGADFVNDRLKANRIKYHQKMLKKLGIINPSTDVAHSGVVSVPH
jgi:transposase